MTQNKLGHPAAEALSYELDIWEQRTDESRWYFSTVDGRLTAEEFDDEDNHIATYSVALADIPFTKHNTN